MSPLLRACHLPPTLAVTGITTALAVSAGRGASAVWVALAALSGQLSVGWHNDATDADRDRAAGRTDKPVATGEVDRALVRRCAYAAATLCVPLSLLSGWRAAAVHLAAVSLAWAYNAGLKSTVLSPLPYTAAFAGLPAFVTLGLPGRPAPPWWALTAGGLLGAGAHFTNTLPDLAADAQTGVRGLPHRVGARGSLLLAAVLLGGATTVLALAPPGRGGGEVAGLLLALVTVSGVVVAGLAARARLAWTLTLATAALAVGLLLARGASLA